MDSARRAPDAPLDRLCVKSGVSLGLLPDADREAVLAYAVVRVPHGRDLTEADVNGVLRGFLAAGGAMLRTDHVELRRWLIDARWLERDGFGRRYRLADGASDRAAALLGDASADRLDARVEARRAADAEARRLRREQHRQPSAA